MGKIKNGSSIVILVEAKTENFTVNRVHSFALKS